MWTSKSKSWWVGRQLGKLFDPEADKTLPAMSGRTHSDFKFLTGRINGTSPADGNNDAAVGDANDDEESDEFAGELGETDEAESGGEMGEMGETLY